MASEMAFCIFFFEKIYGKIIRYGIEKSWKVDMYVCILNFKQKIYYFKMFSVEIQCLQISYRYFNILTVYT